MINKGKGCISAIFNGSIPIGVIKHGLDTIFQKPSEPVEPSPIEGYTILDSIYGNGKQYAIIDYYANQNTKVEMKFAYENNADYPASLFNSRTSSTSAMFGFFPYEGGSKKTRSAFGTQNSEFALASADTEHIVIKDGIYTYIDGELKVTHTAQTFTSTNPMYVLTQPSSSATPLEARIYYMKIWDNGTLVHDLIPALNDETGIAGLYDLITKEFITSATTTEFHPIYQVGELNYVGSGLYANYAGVICTPTKWLDIVNGKNITLYNNPVYNTDKKGFTFNSNSMQYGKATIVVPPDDFTIEIYGSIPNLTEPTSKTVVMFGGIWGYYKGYGLLGGRIETNAFIATGTGSSSTTTCNASDIMEANLKTKWVVRRKKETGEHTVYAKNTNGDVTYTETKTTATLGSDPANQFIVASLKPGSTTLTDYSTATYYAIRLYNKYLTDEEIAQNHAEDVRLYGA